MTKNAPNVRYCAETCHLWNSARHTAIQMCVFGKFCMNWSAYRSLCCLVFVGKFSAELCYWLLLYHAMLIFMLPDDRRSTQPILGRFTDNAWYNRITEWHRMRLKVWYVNSNPIQLWFKEVFVEYLNFDALKVVQSWHSANNLLKTFASWRVCTWRSRRQPIVRELYSCWMTLEHFEYVYTINAMNKQSKHKRFIILVSTPEESRASVKFSAGVFEVL